VISGWSWGEFLPAIVPGINKKAKASGGFRLPSASVLPKSTAIRSSKEAFDLMNPMTMNFSYMNKHAFNWLAKFGCALAMVAVLSGCQTSGKKLELSAKGEVHEGMSRDEVLKILGKPDFSARGFKELAVDRFVAQEKDYRFLPADSGYDGPTVVDSLTVLYTADRKVAKVHHSRGNVVWNSRTYGDAAGGTIAHTLDTRSIKEGETTLTELKAWFGEPTSTSLYFDEQLSYEWVFIKSGYLTGAKVELLRTSFDAHGKVENLVVWEDWNWDY